MAVLVTGVGYIGSRLVVDLLEHGQEVVAIDNHFSTDAIALERLKQRAGFHFVHGDVGDRQVIQKALGLRPIEAVFSLAAQSSGHPQAADPRYTETTNLLAPRLLLDAMLAYGIETIVFASSLRVYGNALPSTVNAETPYGRFSDLSHLSKCYVEKLLEMYATLHGLRCLSLRLGVVHGVAPIMKTDYRFMTAPNKFCLQLVRGEPIQIYAAGHATTGYIHVADASAAMMAVARQSDLTGYAILDVFTEVTSAHAVAAQVAWIGRARGLRAEVMVEGAFPAEEPSPPARPALAGQQLEERNLMRHSLSEVMSYYQCASS
ncbi:MAG: NAD(P)-dependent oxidoreductase [Chloroflexota bacterium]|nr:MAG: NAD(P)-dependent oxidoreductase [Chloroflexota bacterium]